ncbi:MAG: DUF3035 domain-containing protein [Alphaproteobacteria bacterium]|nr:DUF3035 domain-containing protein [Alphaproteobacteria bacterium]
MLRPITTFALLAPLCIGLAACTGNDVRQSLGMKRNQPDEFQVVSRPALSVPPVYYLRPPSEEPVSSGVTAAEQAQSLVFTGESVPYVAPGASDPNYQAETATPIVSESTLRTAGDESFLRNAKAANANDDIRKVLNEENKPFIEAEKQEKDFIDKLRPDAQGEPVVDAAKERERIQTNKAEGKPVNEGEVAVQEPKQESTLERLFK